METANPTPENPEPTPTPTNPEPAPEVEQDSLEDNFPVEPVQQPAFNLEALKETIERSKQRSKAIPSVLNEEEDDGIPDHGDRVLRTFDDLMAAYPIGDGEFYVYVERKAPKTFRGVKIEGIQKPVEEKMTHKEFAARYGAGQYSLMVYGPVKNRRLDSEGKLMMKRYSKAVRVDVSDPYGDNPPQADMAAVVDDEEDLNMTDERVLQNPRRRGPASEADAEIHKATLSAEAQREERRWERMQAQKERAERRQREEEAKKEAEVNGTLSLVRDMIQQNQNKKGDLSEVAVLLESIKPKTDPNEIRRIQEQAAAELQRVKEQADAERRRLEDQLRLEQQRRMDEIQEIRNAESRRFEDERHRAQERLKDTEDNYRRQMDEERRRAREMVEDAQRTAQLRIEELRTTYEGRLNDERRQHDRDLQNHGQIGQSQVVSMQQNFELRLQSKDDELRRLESELKKTQRELEAEKQKDLSSRIGEFTATAEALGFSKEGEDGPKDWKSMLGEAAMGFVQHAPQLAGNVVSSLRGGQQSHGPTPQLPAPQQMMQQQQMPAFATDGVDMDFEDDPMAPIQPSSEFDSSMYPNMPESIQQPTQSQPPPPQQPQARPQQEQPQPQPEQPQQAGDISDDQILQFSEAFREAYEGEKDPGELAKEIHRDLGKVPLRVILSQISLERVNHVLQNAESGDSDPLVRRDGQRFLKRLWEHLHSEVAA